MQPRRTIAETPVRRGERVLVRVDYNVPLEAGEVTDDRRIRASLPTIGNLLERGACVLLLSHLGRPKGQVRPELSLRPVARRLAHLLPEHPVRFVEAFDGPSAAPAVAQAQPGDVLLLENLRFHPGEERNDPDYAAGLARLGELFVSDAFSICHRAHASVVGIAATLRAVAGLALAAELRALAPLLAIDRTSPEPPRPFALVAGGAKVSDKIGLLEALIPRLDVLLIGGAMAYTFLRARGEPTGRSRVEEDRIELAARLLALAEQHGSRVVLPHDHVVAPSLDAPPEAVEVVREIPADRMGLDVGPSTRSLYTKRLRAVHTAIWNGPLGVFERPPFAEGTRAIAHAFAELAERGGTAVVGGGETAAAAERFGVAQRVSHVSTGGGAFLKFLEGKPLPGVAVLEPAEG
ncbi:MAG: phosphoglycerate kinase [Planctomycetota bacterium]|nr:MAG: phosphoglycerate kinase [Planctomycetota bacterium]